MRSEEGTGILDTHLSSGMDKRDKGCCPCDGEEVAKGTAGYPENLDITALGPGNQCQDWTAGTMVSDKRSSAVLKSYRSFLEVPHTSSPSF